jgi:hypothetical protein
MKIVAMILGLLGGLSGFALSQLLGFMSCRCAMPPEYVKRPVEVFMESTVGQLVYALAAILAPLAALVALVIAVLYVIPRFAHRKVSRIGIISGILLAFGVGIITLRDEAVLVSVVPGILVILGGLLADRSFSAQMDSQPGTIIARQPTQ